MARYHVNSKVAGPRMWQENFFTFFSSPILPPFSPPEVHQNGSTKVKKMVFTKNAPQVVRGLNKLGCILSYFQGGGSLDKIMKKFILFLLFVFCNLPLRNIVQTFLFYYFHTYQSIFINNNTINYSWPDKTCH